MRASSSTPVATWRVPLSGREVRLMQPTGELARRVVEDGIHRYAEIRRARVAAFVDAHYSLKGALRLHQAALGLDLLRAPANLFLSGPQCALKAAATAAGAVGAPGAARSLRGCNLLLRTAVGRRIEWLVVTELLELPLRQGERISQHDALAETILDDPRVTGPLHDTLAAIGTRGDDPVFRSRLAETLGAYAGTRAAAAEITTSLATLSAGAMAMKQVTPGAVTLGPALAANIAQHAAVSAFPFGPSLGGMWYAMFPVAPPLALVAGLTGGLLAAAGSFAAFAGIIADPIQRRFGLHRKRLLHMIDALERQMLNPDAPAFAVHDHYVARLLDLLDLLGCAYRLAHTA